MANPIKLFPCVQECFRFMGIFPFQSNRKCLSTNLIRAIFLICCVQWMLTTAAFFVFAATSMFEYGFAFCMLNCIIADIVVYLIFIWQSDNALKFFEKCEGFIKQSKYWLLGLKLKKSIFNRQSKLENFASAVIKNI